MFEEKVSLFKRIFQKEIKKVSVNVPSNVIYDYIRKHINEKIDWGFNISGYYLNKSLHGKCYEDKIIYYVRPPSTSGFRYKTIIKFDSALSNTCELTVIRNSLKYYIHSWLIILFLLIPVFIFSTFNTHEYTVTVNGVTNIVEGHPYWVLGFPLLFCIIMTIFYFCIKSSKTKAESFFDNIIINFNSERILEKT